MFLVADDIVRYISDDIIDLREDVPIGMYKVVHNDYGSFLQKTTYGTEHGKIYGTSQKNADHIVAAYTKKDTKANLGVLFSGGKGLGKSLTVRLVVEQLKDKCPVIFVSDYTDDLVDFLMNIRNSIIIFDEFEKTMSGNINNSKDDTNVESKQESLLSLFDGTNTQTNNLYLLTCNYSYKIDSNMLSRPGRIKYHFKYDSIDEAAIRAYCDDHLVRKELIDDIVSSLIATRYVSIDIVKAVVDELNMFEDTSVDEVMDYLNIVSEDVEVIGDFVFEYKGKTYELKGDDMGRYRSSQNHWVWSVERYEDETKENSEYLCFNIIIDCTKFKVPKVGRVDITPYTRVSASDIKDYQLISATIRDAASTFDVAYDF